MSRCAQQASLTSLHPPSSPCRLLPSRYVQWSCTTPTMLFTLSKISDFTPLQTGTTMFLDWLMILTGFIAAMLPPGYWSGEGTRFPSAAPLLAIRSGHKRAR